MPFGRYKGRTLPEIIGRDVDWLFWVVPKLYGRIADEAQDLARRARAVKTACSTQRGMRLTTPRTAWVSLRKSNWAQADKRRGPTSFKQSRLERKR